jgi:chromosome partitioning protein
MVTSILNHKGGVGKTTTTLNLGKALSLEGFKVLLVDIDPQANLSQHVGIEDPENSIYDLFQGAIELPRLPLSDKLDLVPSDLALINVSEDSGANQLKKILVLKKAIDTISDEYDFILIDCPPALGLLTNNALLASTNVIIPLQSHFLPLKGMDTIFDAVESAKEINPMLEVSGILITQTDQTVMTRSIVEAVKAAYPELVYETMIRRSVSLVESTSQQTDIFSYDEKSAGAQDYKKFSKELLLKFEIHGK